MRAGDKFYRALPSLDMQELTYVGPITRSRVCFHDQYGVEIKMSEWEASQLKMSRIIILNELEEILREKINKIHDILREHKIKFNPLDTPHVIYKRKFTMMHQYDYKTGRYIKSFESITAAMVSLGQDPKKGHRISKACRGLPRFYSYKGFRWSYEKKDRL